MAVWAPVAGRRRGRPPDVPDAFDRLPRQPDVDGCRPQYAGIFMYHCGTPPALLHIGSGMYGAVVVDPPGLDSVDRKYVVLQ